MTHQNCFLVKALRSAAALALLIGEETDERRLSKIAETLANAINKNLWSEEQQAYIDCIHTDGKRSDVFSMQTQVVAYLTNIAKGERRQGMENYLQFPPSHFVQIGSPFMSFFYYEALSEAGRIRELVEDIKKNYGQMIDHDATTCWEMYPNFQENRANPDMLTRSHCHAWSAAPAYFLGREVLGIRMTSTGWKKVVVAPSPCGLTWAKGSVPLPESGRIDVSWKVNDTEKIMELTIRHPRSVKVEILIPVGYQGIISTATI